MNNIQIKMKMNNNKILIVMKKMINRYKNKINKNNIKKLILIQMKINQKRVNFN